MPENALDTPLQPAQATPYLTVIPDRLPKQKVHTNLGHAKNAINYRTDAWGQGTPSECLLYEWKDDEWQLLYRVPAGTSKKNLPWNKAE